MSARVISRGSWLTPGRYGSGDGAISGQLPSRQRLVLALPHQLRRALAARVAELGADPGVAVGVHEVDDPRPRGRVLVRVEAAAAGRDPPFARDADHLRHHQPGAADPARAEVDEVEVARRAVARGVHVHRRDDHAVASSSSRRRNGVNIGGRRTAPKAASTASTNAGVAQLQLAVGDAPAAGEQVEGEQTGGCWSRSARSPRTTRGCPGRRAGCSPRSGGGRPRTPPGRRRGRPDARAAPRPARSRPRARAWCRSRSRSARCARRRRAARRSGGATPRCGRSRS